jgi:hypothetical protein
VSAAADLEALARALPVLTGSAMPLLRIPGGQQDGSPAERAHGLLGPALRAVRRLAAMRARPGRYHAVLALLATHCYAGEARRDSRWPETIALALLPREMRLRTLAAALRGGPDAASASAAGTRIIADAEIEYDDADELASDGRWITEDLDDVSRMLADVEADRAATSTTKTKSTSDARPVVSRCRSMRAVACSVAPSQTECVLGRPRRARAPGSQTWELLAGVVTR